LLAQATVGRVDQGFGLQLSEGLIRVAIFIGYLMLTARAPDLQPRSSTTAPSTCRSTPSRPATR
jgi:hypothetical protein